MYQRSRVPAVVAAGEKRSRNQLCELQGFVTNFLALDRSERQCADKPLILR
jgi:hypothetical protein